MSGDAIKLGPFTGGLNTKSDPSALANNEVARLENFEVDFDGSLRSRPPIINTGINFPLDPGSGSVKALGYWRQNDTSNLLIASDGVSTTYYLSGTSWVSLGVGFSADDIAVWNGALWVGRKNGTGSYVTTSGSAVGTNMPPAGAMCVYKGRLFVSGGKGASDTERGLMHISGVPGFDNPLWSAGTEAAKPPVAIGGGDGESIVSLLSYQNQILIFRTGSIWTYSYSTDPNLFQQAPLITNIGLDDPAAIDQLDGVIYFMYEGRAYTMNNGRVQQLNDKVPFTANARANYGTPFAVSVFGRRVLFSYYDTTYVFSPDTQTWATWTSYLGGLGKFYQRVGATDAYPVVTGFPNLNSGLGSGRFNYTMRITDTFSSEAEASPYTTIVQTKNYDYDTASQFKVLFWWGVDTTFRSALTAVATPIAYHSQVTWADMLSLNWSQAQSFFWDQPKSAVLQVTTNRDASGLGPLKKFIKLAKKLRFVQINYRVSILTDGATTTAPVKIFDIVTYVLSKEHVVKPVS